WHAGYDPMRAVRTADYKYIRCWEDRPVCFLPNVDPAPTRDYVVAQGLHNAPRPKEMLFNLALDGDEQNNLAGDPMHAEILDELRGMVDDWMRQTDDPLLAGRVE